MVFLVIKNVFSSGVNIFLLSVGSRYPTVKVEEKYLLLNEIGSKGN